MGQIILLNTLLFFQSPSATESSIAWGLLIIILLFIILLSKRSEVIGQWNHLFPDMQHDPEEFYTLVEELLTEWQIPDCQTERKTFHQGNLLSNQRLYLEVSRGDYIYHICAAPWGTGFFFSWWLREVSAFFERFGSKQKLKVDTYYRRDTDATFRACVQQCVQSAVDRITEAKGVRGLTELERQPDLRSVFHKKQ